MGFSNLTKMKTYFHYTDYSLASVLTKNPLWHKYIHINLKKGSKALSKIEPKTEIEANFDESFTHFKLTLGYTTNRCGVLQNSNVKATEHNLYTAKMQKKNCPKALGAIITN